MSPRALTVLVVHGPNLNLLGLREPERYGTATLDAVDAMLRARAGELGVTVDTFQSNHEGAILDRLHAARGAADGIVINPGGLTHTSVCLRDALLGVSIPAVECHLTNTDARERFRRRSLIADVCVGRVSGFGATSYRLALDAIVDHLQRRIDRA